MELGSLPGAVTRGELLAAGYRPGELQQAVDRGAVIRLARGVFAPPGIVDATPEQRHAQLAIAMARRRSGALAWMSAAAVHGLPIWGMRTDQVHLADDRGRSGTHASGSVIRHGDRRPAAVTEIGGTRVISVARTVVDLARTQARVPAIATGDAALHKQLCGMDDLRAELDLAKGYRGHAQAERVLALLNAGSESVLESRSRILVIDAPHLPDPEVQVDVFDDVGLHIGRADLLWREERLIGECDGDGKYLGQYGIAPELAVIREKERTDRLHEAGWRVVRWNWRELAHPERVLARISRMLHGAATA